MDDAVIITSPVKTLKTVGNSPGVKIPENEEKTLYALMWTDFVLERSKRIEAPQNSSPGSRDLPRIASDGLDIGERKNGEGIPATRGTTLGYDANGNLTSYGTDIYGWDYRNRMASSTVGGLGATYGYDHSMQRVSKTMNAVTTVYPNQYFEKEGTATTTKYIWAGGDLIATVNGNGVSTTTEYIHSDHLGSTNVTTDSSGAVTSVLDYLPFGSERISTGDELPGRGYIAQFTDREQDLSYLQNRYYSSDRGQFISQDPVFWEIGQTPDGMAVLQNPQLQNSYSYSGNNPITYKDPSGRLLWAALPVIIGVYSAASSYVDRENYIYTLAYPNGYTQQERDSAQNQVVWDFVTLGASGGLTKLGRQGLDAATAAMDVLEHYWGEEIYDKVNKKNQQKGGGVSGLSNNQTSSKGSAQQNKSQNQNSTIKNSTQNSATNRALMGIENQLKQLERAVKDLKKQINKKNK